MLKAAVVFIVAAGLLLGVAACGKSTIDQSSEVDLVNKQLSSQHLKAKSVDCPSGVEAKEGTTFSCDVVLTNGNTGTFDIELQGRYEDPEALIAALRDQLGLVLTKNTT